METSTVRPLLKCLDSIRLAKKVVVFMLYNDKERHAAERVVHDMVKRAIEMEGAATVSLDTWFLCSRVALILGTKGEHGVGLVKRDYLPHELGPSTVDAMRHVSLFIDEFLPGELIADVIPTVTDQECVRSSVSSQL